LGGLGIVKTGSDRTKSEAKAKFKEGLRDYEDGLAIAPSGHRVKPTSACAVYTRA
jgi:hypothetical protein